MNLAQLKYEYNNTDDIQKRIMLRKILDSRIKNTKKIGQKKNDSLIHTYISFIKSKRRDGSESESDVSIEVSDIESINSFDSVESDESKIPKIKREGNKQPSISTGNKLLERFMTEADFRNKQPINKIIKPYYDDGGSMKTSQTSNRLKLPNKTLGRRKNIN
jgi:hypothetical protein